MSTRDMPDKLRDRFWKEVKAEFPHDYALQAIHFARKVIGRETEGFSPDQVIDYFRKAGQRMRKRGDRGQT